MKVTSWAAAKLTASWQVSLPTQGTYGFIPRSFLSPFKHGGVFLLTCSFAEDALGLIGCVNPKRGQLVELKLGLVSVWEPLAFQRSTVQTNTPPVCGDRGMDFGKEKKHI